MIRFKILLRARFSSLSQELQIRVSYPLFKCRLTCRTSATPVIATMCNVPSGAETYAKLYESVSSDGVSLTLL